MSTFPTSPYSALLVWAKTHAPQWEAHAAEVGLSPEQAAGYAQAAAEYEAAAMDRESALHAYRASVEFAESKFRRLRNLSGDRVRAIRAFAEDSESPGAVYALALIPPVSAPSPVAAPGRPTDFRVSLDSRGAVSLRWKCPNPKGANNTVYTVRRRTAGAGGFVHIGTVGVRRFTDAAIPAGAAAVEYTVQAQRGTAVGPASNIFSVPFGTGGLPVTAQGAGGGAAAKVA